MRGLVDRISSEGVAVVPDVYSQTEAGEIAAKLSAVLLSEELAGASARTSKGTVYAARNVLEIWPPARDVWKQSKLVSLLNAILGREFGLVRALFFDKPPDRTW